MKFYTYLLAIGALLAITAADFHNSGTPKSIPAAFDCAVRVAAWKHGKTLLPGRGDFTTLFDAMQLENGCGLVRPSTEDEWTPPTYSTPPGSTFVDSSNGSDTKGNGEAESPFASLSRAVEAVLKTGSKTIVLRAGTYYTQQIELGPEHSGLTVQNFNGEHATVSGTFSLTFSQLSCRTPFVICRWRPP
jgi:hypothetical protein